MNKWITFGLTIFLVILQYRLWKGDGSLIDVIRLSHSIKTEREQIAKLTERNQLLDAEVQLLKTKPKAFEERARAELGMIKKGETFCLVIEPAR